MKNHRFEIIDLKIDMLVDEIKILEVNVEVGALSPDEFVARSKACSYMWKLLKSKNA